jgi:hypothetical protein
MSASDFGILLIVVLFILAALAAFIYISNYNKKRDSLAPAERMRYESERFQREMSNRDYDTDFQLQKDEKVVFEPAPAYIIYKNPFSQTPSKYFRGLVVTNRRISLGMTPAVLPSSKKNKVSVPMINVPHLFGEINLWHPGIPVAPAPPSRLNNPIDLNFHFHTENLRIGEISSESDALGSYVHLRLSGRKDTYRIYTPNAEKISRLFSTLH